MTYDEERLYWRIARNVKRERRRQKLGQRALAAAALTSQTHISHIETAKHPIQVHLLARVARALKVPVASLLS